MGKLELGIIAEHEQSGVRWSDHIALCIMGSHFQAYQEIDWRNIALPLATVRCPKREMLLNGLHITIIKCRSCISCPYRYAIYSTFLL